MTQITVPTRDEVSSENQAIFDNLQKQLGFVPNIYATIGHSDNALGAYLNFSQAQAKGSLTAKEREAISLVVSQVNNCRYCQSAHTVLGKMNGYTEDEIIELRKGRNADAKIDSLVKLAKEIAVSRGKVSGETLETFFAAGYSQGSLMDVTLAVTEITYTNLIHNITEIPIDFPIALDLNQEAAA